LINTAWKAPEVQGIDYSTMLFGLAALPQFLGKDFFIRNNNFFDFSTASKTEIQNFTEAFVLKNQTRDKIEFAFVKPVDSPAEIQILNLNLEIVFRQKVQNRNIGETRLVSISGLANGVYFLRILQDDRNLGVKKFVKY
jgi:hypothetical protein